MEVFIKHKIKLASHLLTFKKANIGCVVSAVATFTQHIVCLRIDVLLPYSVSASKHLNLLIIT